MRINKAQAPFHISFLVHDINEATDFYSYKLGFQIIREYPLARHFDCYGTHLVAHERKGFDAKTFQVTVEDDEFVVPHAGVILGLKDWEDLAERLMKKNFIFFTQPHPRFIGQPHEQKVMFLRDPSGNAFEFKCYKNFPPEEWL